MTILAPDEIGDSAEIRADLCIIGSGAAGITIALLLAESGLKIVMLAGGGRRFSHRAQLLYHGRNVGRENFAPGKSRLRMFGGSTTRWAGQCRPLDPVDFEARQGLPDTGWPIGPDALAPYHPEAARLCDLDDWRFDPPPLAGLSGDAAADILPVRYRHGRNVDFALAYGPALASAASVRVLLDTHASELVTRGDRVSHVRAVTDRKRALRIHADTVVLATGGIENARLLLASRSDHPNGLGNAHDMVGRHFMDHPFFFGGFIDLASDATPEDVGALEGYEQAGVAQRAHGAFALGEEARRSEGLNGAAVFFVGRPAHKTTSSYLSKGGVALTRFIEVVTHSELPDGRLGRHMAALLTDMGNAGRSAGERLLGAARRRRVLAARFTLEALPNPDSRVRLDPGRRDRFGMPHVRVDWRLREGDRLGLERLKRGLASLLEERGIGRLHFNAAEGPDGFPVALEGGKHHMGTTRMSLDPRRGVVDPDCRLHGVENLYVAGSSVFPTGGYVNPTFTVVCLALRLAERLGIAQLRGVKKGL